MKRAGIVATVILALLAVILGFGGVTAGLLITQPAVSGSAIVEHFEVKKLETTASVAERLQAAGLVRNATAFRLLARFRKLDTGIEPGVYTLSPGMTMDQIIRKLQQGKPDEVIAGVNEGLRVTQYPDGFANLPNFNAKDFLDITKTGVLTDGTKTWEKYWFVAQPDPKKVPYALEGYLYPDHYSFAKDATAQVVVDKMLTAFGEYFCPGPTSKPDAYVMDQAQCKAHAATVDDKGTTVFQTLEKYYDKDDRTAIYQALTIASIAMREIPSIDATADIQGIASVYYNRYQHFLGKLDSDTGLRLEADPTVQYAITSEKAPSDGNWWPDFGANASCKDVVQDDVYNTCTHDGLPPGPISAPLWNVFVAAASPHSPDGKTYFYFINAKCPPHKTYFATTVDEHNANIAKYLNPNIKCS